MQFRSEDGARLDRDIVVAWAVAGDDVSTQLSIARTGAEHRCFTDAYGLLTVMPPAQRPQHVPRDLIVLIGGKAGLCDQRSENPNCWW